jgi:hypothetical protein
MAASHGLLVVALLAVGPARAACNGFRHRNDTALDALSKPYKQQGRTLLVGPRRQP